MADGVVIRVRVTPRASRNAVQGKRSDGVIVLRVLAPPVDGAANKACRELLAELLGVAKTTVTITGGETARDKRFAVSGITEAKVQDRLSALPMVQCGE